MLEVDDGTKHERCFDLPLRLAFLSPLQGALRIALPEIDAVTKLVPFLAGKLQVLDAARKDVFAYFCIAAVKAHNERRLVFVQLPD
jgi:hypothetical protein